MERSLGAVVTLVPRRYGMLAMKSLPRESDFECESVLTLVVLTGVDGVSVGDRFDVG
jgi:hypothetical protein